MPSAFGVKGAIRYPDTLNLDRRPSCDLIEFNFKFKFWASVIEKCSLIFKIDVQFNIEYFLT